MIAFRWRALVISAFALAVAAPVSAEEPWFGEMPAVAEVQRAAEGRDPFDTAARQWVAFSNLYETTKALIGDRFFAGEMTAAERQLRDTYLGNRDRVQRELQASLPAEERDFYVGTRFAAWSELRSDYLADKAFNNQILAAVFSSDFRTANRSLLEEHWLSSRGMGLVPTPRPNLVNQLGPLFALPLLALVGFVIAIVVKRGRMTLDGKNPFKLYLGGGTFNLRHVTGKVENASKMASTSVYASGGGGSVDAYGGTINPISIGSTTTVHDQFFIRAGERLESIQLKGWDFAVADGHLVSAIWAVQEGTTGGHFIVLRNHTTGDSSFARLFLDARAVRTGGLGLWLVELLLCGVAAFIAAPYVELVPGIVAGVVGVILGAVVWHVTIRPRFLRGFQRKGLPRLHAELDRAAASATAAT
jgi:hypothetical protein